MTATANFELEEDLGAYKEYGRFKKNSREEVIVARKRYKIQGAWQDYLDIRVWYRRSGSDSLSPGKGLTLKGDLCGELLTTLTMAMREMGTDGE